MSKRSITKPSSTITFELSVDSINKAIKELRNYQKWVDKKKAELIKRLAEYGVEQAKIHFNGIVYKYFDVNGYSYESTMFADIRVEKAENGWSVLATDDEICFVEFGAGVYHNGAESYPGKRPDGIVGIGEYGGGQGKNNSWFVGNAEEIYTHGIKAQAPIYKASVDMQDKLTEIAKEVFQ